MNEIVSVEGLAWVPVTKDSRLPDAYHYTAWAYHKRLGVIVSRGNEFDWRNGNYTHWIPETARRTDLTGVLYQNIPEPPPPVPVTACKHCGHPL